MRALVLALVLLAGPVMAQAQEMPETGYQSPHYKHFPPLIVDAQPGPLHRAIFELMESCSLTRGDFEGIIWNVATFITNPDGGSTWAYWDNLPDGRRVIWVQEDVWNNPGILSHEILHDLARGDFTADLAQRCVIKFSGLLTAGM